MTRTARLVIKQTVAPTAEPVTLTEAKAHCRVDIADDDTLIGSLISSAREHIESMTRAQMMPATWRLSLDGFPPAFRLRGAFYRQEPDGTDIILPRPPLTAITSVKYYDMDGVLQTVSSDVYAPQTDENPGRVTLKYGQQWPDAQPVANAVQVLYTAGYSTGVDVAVSQDSVPKSLKQAILMLVGHWYENREATGSMSDQVAFAVTSLCAPHTCTEVW